MPITGIEFLHTEDLSFGDLRVYFDTSVWDTEQDGLIYTDSLFLKELEDSLNKMGIHCKMDYSEQGMQGDDFVSLDCDSSIIEWMTENENIS